MIFIIMINIIIIIIIIITRTLAKMTSQPFNTRKQSDKWSKKNGYF